MHNTLGEAAEAGADAVRALERRVDRLGTELGVEVHCDSLWTRDMRTALHDYASRFACKWVVMEWVPRDRRGAFFLHDPLAWLLDHLPSNLALFKDAGGHHGRRIMVLVEPGPHDGLVVNAAAKLGRVTGAELTFYRALPEKAAAWEVEAVVDYHEQLGLLVDVPSESKVERHPKPLSAVIQATADYDLLVAGAPAERGMWGMFFGSDSDRIMAESVCSVLRLKTPRKETHQAASELLAEESPVDLVERLSPALVLPRLSVSSKNDLFKRIAEIFAAADARNGNASDIEAALWHREKMQNTAIGDGIAIPHATVAGTPGTSLAAVTLTEPLKYGAAGADGVRLVFVTVGPPSDRATHLQLLARLSQLLLATSLIARLDEAQDAEAVLAAFRAASAEADAAGA